MIDETGSDLLPMFRVAQYRNLRWARQRDAEAKGEEEEVVVGRGEEKRARL